MAYCYVVFDLIEFDLCCVVFLLLFIHIYNYLLNSTLISFTRQQFEHPNVPAKCCPGIDSLVQNVGAVIIIATHKPHHWEALQSRRVVALSSGKILSEEVLEKGRSNTMNYK